MMKVNDEPGFDVLFRKLALPPGGCSLESRQSATRGNAVMGRWKRIRLNMPFPHPPLFILAQGSRKKKKNPLASTTCNHSTAPDNWTMLVVSRSLFVSLSGTICYMLVFPLPPFVNGVMVYFIHDAPPDCKTRGLEARMHIYTAGGSGFHRGTGSRGCEEKF